MRGTIVLLLIFLLADAFFVVTATDHFLIDVDLICNAKGKYNYNLQFFEKDTFTPNDVLTNQLIGEAPRGLSHFQLKGTQDGDEVWSSGYEVRMVVHHDCTKNGKEVTLALNLLPECYIAMGTCHYTIKRDLTDQSGEEDFPVKLMYA